MKNNQAVYTDRILRHYITLALRNAGISIDGDIHAELDGASVATSIDTAIAPLLERITELEKKVQELADARLALQFFVGISQSSPETED